MKFLTWKVLLSTLNPSPIFVAVANFAEVLAMDSIQRSRITDQGKIGQRGGIPAAAKNSIWEVR